MAVYKSKKATKDGRQYYFRIKYKDIFGIAHDYSSPKFKNKRDAEKEEALYRIKIANQEIAVSNITIEQAYLEFLSLKRQENKKQSIEKIENLYKHLNPIKNIKIKDITISTYKKLRLHIENLNFSANYSNKIQNLFKQIILYSNKYYNTSNDIIKFIEKFKDVNSIKKEMQFFTLEEYLKFDSVIDIFDYHTFFEILFYMGLRQGEAQALTWKEIDLKNNVLKVKKTLTTKLKGEKWTISSPKTKNSIRTLPLTKKLVEDLKIMNNNAKQYKNYSDDWFVFGNVAPFAESSIQKKKNDYCKLAEVKQIRIHDFRHSCATLLINNGASIALVSKWLGHGDISITLKVYTHLYENELNKMVNLLDNL